MNTQDKIEFNRRIMLDESYPNEVRVASQKALMELLEIKEEENNHYKKEVHKN